MFCSDVEQISPLLQSISQRAEFATQISPLNFNEFLTRINKNRFMFEISISIKNIHTNGGFEMGFLVGKNFPGFEFSHGKSQTNHMGIPEIST